MTSPSPSNLTITHFGSVIRDYSKMYEKLPCKVCGGIMRYKSNEQCVTCHHARRRIHILTRNLTPTKRNKMKKAYWKRYVSLCNDTIKPISIQEMFLVCPKSMEKQLNLPISGMKLPNEIPDNMLFIHFEEALVQAGKLCRETRQNVRVMKLSIPNHWQPVAKLSANVFIDEIAAK